MASFSRVNGDNKPVANYDVPTYSNTTVDAVTSAATVQPQGPKLDFFTFTAVAALTGADVTAAIKTIQQLATVYLYEYTDDSSDTLAVAVYPTAAWTDSGLQTALQALGGNFASGTVAAEATFTGA